VSPVSDTKLEYQSIISGLVKKNLMADFRLVLVNTKQDFVNELEGMTCKMEIIALKSIIFKPE